MSAGQAVPQRRAVASRPVRDNVPQRRPEAMVAGLAESFASALTELPVDALPREPGAQLTYVRTERFELTGADGAGAGRNIAYSCEHRVVVNPAQSAGLPDSQMRAGIGPRLAIGIALAAVLVGGVIGYGLYQPPPRRPHAVTILLDRPRAAAASARAVAPRQVAPRRGAAITLPISAADPAAAARIESPPPARGATTHDMGRAIDAALAMAFATNEMQNWEAGGQSGVVVVGPAALASGSICRDVAVLTRSDSAKETTVNSRRCQTRDGRMLAAPTAAPAPAEPAEPQ